MESAQNRFNFSMKQKLKCGFRLRILSQEKIEIQFFDFSLPSFGMQSLIVMYIREHTVVVSQTKVGILDAQMHQPFPCTRTSLLTQPGLAGKTRELA